LPSRFPATSNFVKRANKPTIEAINQATNPCDNMPLRSAVRSAVDCREIHAPLSGVHRHRISKLSDYQVDTPAKPLKLRHLRAITFL
jgi:hypothetical protein